MAYTALYRKFRPQTFAEVKGQDHVVRTLRNQIITHRTGHAYLFAGTRGTGKTSVAKIMAKALNCLDPKDGEPCNECENCRAINSGSFMDVIEMDAASNNGVDDIRQLIEEVGYTPAKGKYKVFIIDEAHMITRSAFNAFLKTLEEPPSYAVFILATTEPHKLPQTILSRLQRYDFKRIPAQTIKENLKDLTQKEGIRAEDKALSYIARLGDGSMRDAISLLDKSIACCLGKDLTYDQVLEALGASDTEVYSDLLRDVYSADTAKTLKDLDKAVYEGKDLTVFVEGFCGYLRDVLLVGIDPESAEDITGVSAENLALLKEDAARTDSEILIRYIKILSELLNKMRFSSVKQLLAEVEFIKLARPQMETDNSALLDRIRQLEARPALAENKGALAEELSAAQKKASEEDLSEKKEEKEKLQPQTGFERSSEEKNLSAAEDIKEAAAPCVNWKEALEGLESRQLKTALRNGVFQEENGRCVIYFNKKISQQIAEGGLGEIKEVLKKQGFEGEVLIKEGLPEDPEDKDLFKDINFDIETEEF